MTCSQNTSYIWCFLWIWRGKKTSAVHLSNYAHDDICVHEMHACVLLAIWQIHFNYIKLSTACSLLEICVRFQMLYYCALIKQWKSTEHFWPVLVFYHGHLVILVYPKYLCLPSPYHSNRDYLQWFIPVIQSSSLFLKEYSIWMHSEQVFSATERKDVWRGECRREWSFCFVFLRNRTCGNALNQLFIHKSKTSWRNS